MCLATVDKSKKKIRDLLKLLGTLKRKELNQFGVNVG